MEDNNFNPQPPIQPNDQPGNQPMAGASQPQPAPATPVNPPAPAAQPMGSQQQAGSRTGATDTKTSEMEDKVFAALSYISILFVVPLILKQDNPQIKFHAKQGMVLFGTEVVVWFLLFLLESFFVSIAPLSGFRLVSWLGALAWLLFVVLSLMGVYYAWNGKQWKIFLLHRIADKINI